MKFLLSFILVVTALSTFSLYAQQEKLNLSGRWHLDVANPILMGPHLDLELKQSGTTITGTAQGQLGGGKIDGPYLVNGTIDGYKVTFTIKGEFRVISNGTDKRVDVVYLGREKDENKVEGTVELPGVGSGTWTAKRQ